MLPGTSGRVHRDPCGEKAATSGGKEGKNANKNEGVGGERERTAAISKPPHHMVDLFC